MECRGGGHRVGAVGGKGGGGQGELHEEMALHRTSENGQHLNRWSGISLPSVVIRSAGH